MTCVVGIKDKSGVYIGADYVFSSEGGDDKPYCGGVKVFRKDDYLVAFCGHVRFGQIIQFSFRPPVPPKVATMKFMATKFAKALASVLDSEDYTGTSEGCLLVAVRGKLFMVDDDKAVIEVDNFASIGTGSTAAKAALLALGEVGLELTTEQRINVALKTSANLLNSVGGPFTIIKA